MSRVTSATGQPMLEPSVAHCIDRLWCDVHGVYVAGWAHAFGVPLRAVRLGSGSATAETDIFTDRSDVAAHFRDPRLLRSGFALYLACAPFAPVTLTIVTAEGSVAQPVVAPATDAATEPAPRPAPMDVFIAEAKRLGGTVVEIGARVVGPASILQASRFGPECRHVGVDIHAAPGVDVVADAHHLSAAFPPGSVSGVFSLAVMEHLAMPWLVAAEINAVLAEGGVVFHLLPHTFPVHEQPNDFWRMSDEALKVLYGPATGFEVIDAAMMDPVQIYHAPTLRTGPFLEMPLHPGMASAYILARKVAAIAPGSVRWPMDANDIRSQSLQYPAHRGARPAPEPL